MSYRDIAKALNVSVTTAYTDIKRSLEELHAKEVKEARLMRQLEAERLNRLLARIATKIRDGDLKAIDKAIKISDRLRRLYGLDLQPVSDPGLLEPPRTVGISVRTVGIGPDVVPEDEDEPDE